ncbi:beta-galactosidase [Caldanaerobius polysaccharolyticus]|uniref:beta-galactosidase n=1 Tax=Caldanaerobius polysaccharolyticus TaxID=44256 RepID=UPI00055326DD|nr:beta-galactosidase [Caldanaerobius polysaccharolyticus]
MFYGVDYYPEHWSEERWEIDAKLMREANMNIVRLAEFAWAKIEPEEGKFDFSWLDKVVEILEKNGIKVILGTPTAAPPKWLMDKCPDIYPVDYMGHTYGFGLRKHTCYNSENLYRYTEIIVSKMAEHYKDCSAVFGWQIDNEFGGRCYCDKCQKAFRKWLKKKYITIDQLNKEWGTIFWSQVYRNWDEIISPRYSMSADITTHNPGLVLDYYRFYSDTIVAFQKFQIDILRKIVPHHVITHNFMKLYNGLNYFDLAKDLDFVSWDNYPGTSDNIIEPALAHDVARGLKNTTFWVMEQQSGPRGWQIISENPEPGQMRLFAYQSIAHGADAIIYFRWRTCPFGTEQYWHGILGHDGVPRRRYFEAKQMGEELKRISSMFEKGNIPAQVAIIRCYDNEWVFEIQPHVKKFRYIDHIRRYYEALFRNNIQVDVVSPVADLGKYKLAIAPQLTLTNEKIIENLYKYVKNGGILISGFRTGARDWNNRIIMDVLPGELRELFGIEIEEYGIIPENKFNLLKFEKENMIINCDTWYEILSPITAQVIARFGDNFFEGSPALTMNNYGNGRAYYIGSVPSEKDIDKFVYWLVKESEIHPLYDKPIPGVEFSCRVKDGKEVLFILNHNSKEVNIELIGSYVDIIKSKKWENHIEIPSKDLVILQKI